jgi:hypothetical protein
LAELILKLYSFATDSQWDIAMKCGLLNLALKVLGDLVKSHPKEDFMEKLKRGVSSPEKEMEITNVCSIRFKLTSCKTCSDIPFFAITNYTVSSSTAISTSDLKQIKNNLLERCRKAILQQVLQYKSKESPFCRNLWVFVSQNSKKKMRRRNDYYIKPLFDSYHFLR